MGCGAHCICSGHKQGKLKTAFPELPDGPEKLQTASPELQDGPEKQKTGFRPEARLPERGHKETGVRQYTPVPHAKECYTNKCPSSHVSEVLPNSSLNSALNRPLLSTKRGNIFLGFFCIMHVFQISVTENGGTYFLLFLCIMHSRQIGYRKRGNFFCCCIMHVFTAPPMLKNMHSAKKKKKKKCSPGFYKRF